MKDRIAKIIANEGISPSKFADIIGVQRSNISHILSGRNNPGLDLLNKILVHFPHISGDWLITGQGLMLKKATNPFKMPSLFDKTALGEKSASNESINSTTRADTINNTSESLIDKHEQENPLIAAVVGLENKAIERIIIFFRDRSFREYHPES